MKILGINNLQNSSAALIVDGCLVAACEEERFKRMKHYRGFPLNSIDFCLKKGGLTFDDIDNVAMGWIPYRGLIHRVTTTLMMALKNKEFSNKVKRGGEYFSIIKEQFYAQKILKKHFKSNKNIKIHYINHHFSHVSCSYFMSGFDQAAVLSLDGTGEYQTLVMGKYIHGNFTKIKEIFYPYSLGHLYSVFTSFLGFKPNSGEGKVMGLAPYGQPTYEQHIKSLLKFDENKVSLIYDTRYIDYSASLVGAFSKKFIDLFGEARQPESKIEDRHQDIAASIQKVTEDIIVALAKSLNERTGISNLCLSGGIALNCVANAKIKERTGFKKIYVPSAPSDAGVSMGSALYLYHNLTHKFPMVNGGSPYLGPDFSCDDCLSIFRKNDVPFRELDDPEKHAALLLSQGNIIGWFQGRMEFGPRSLGARSILASPYPAEMKDIINRRVKFRENFRPFAPAILEEDALDWFDNYCDSPNMSFAFTVKNHLREKIPAVCHIDGRGRFQTVNQQLNPSLYKLLKCYQELTNIPVLLNTSFNVRGEPIVCTPLDAVKCFKKTDMDYLIINKYLIEKNV